jgi:tripartite-type tricarboxylate transporter receptor subunit TctC
MAGMRAETIVACMMAVSFALPASAGAADTAAQFPSRPIRIVIGFTPGGQPDITARLIGPRLTEALGQQVVVDNRPGAGGVTGARIVATSDPDGHTLLSVSAAHVVSPTIHARLGYHPAKDFAGITQTASAAYLLVVTPSLDAKTVKDLIALAKAKPGQINFASGSTGSGTHFAAEILKSAAMIDVVHIPYKGVPEALTDTMAGRTQFFMAPLASSINLVREGKLRALGVSSAKRVKAHPDVPTIAEAALPGFVWDSWAAILAPGKTPRAIVLKLNREITRILQTPDITQRLVALGAEPAPSTPEAIDQLIIEQLKIAADVAKKAGIKAE